MMYLNLFFWIVLGFTLEVFNLSVYSWKYWLILLIVMAIVITDKLIK